MTRVVVVGDVLLDQDLIGRTERLCPDAPVPVVDEELVLERPGGAGLAAALVRRHGLEVTLVSAFADDDGGRRLRAVLADLDVEVVPLRHAGTTAEKLRVRVDGHSIVRLDRGSPGAIGSLSRSAATAIRGADGVLVADYGRGMAGHHELRAAVTSVASGATPVVWDPHPRGATPTPRTTIVTPNRAEAERFTGATLQGSPRPLAAAVAAAERLRAEWGAIMVAVTMGADGAVAVGNDTAPRVVPVTRPGIGRDPCGAGDAFAAAAAVALATGSDPSTSIAAAVAAASRFVNDGGAAQLAAPPGLSWNRRDRGGPDRDVAAEQRGCHVVATTVVTGGCFDVLHAGHVATLEHARRLGDRLVVLLNDDASVRRLKGPTRPAQRCEDRAAVLGSLACVDEVIVFGDDTPVPALRRLRPDVFVKGGDYDPATMPETAAMAEWGGVVVTVPYLEGRSTTRILRTDVRPASVDADPTKGVEHVE